MFQEISLLLFVNIYMPKNLEIILGSFSGFLYKVQFGGDSSCGFLGITIEKGCNYAFGKLIID